MPVNESAKNVKILPGPDERIVHVIVNPASGNGRGERRWRKVERELVDFGFTARVAFTTGPVDATRIAEEFARQGARYILAVGGDGTVNEVVNGLLDENACPRSDARLAVVPCGTGSDLSRSAGVQRPATVLRAIELDSHTTVDVGRLTFRTQDENKPTVRYFANVADVGLGAQVARRSNASTKALGGTASYLVAAVRTVFEVEPAHASVTVDDELVFDGKALMIIFANGRYFAGGMNIAPDSSLRDGLVDIFVLEAVGRRKLLTELLPRVYLGKHVGRPGVHHLQGQCVSVETATPMLIEMDGEPIGVSPLSVEVVPRALKLIASGSVLR